MTDEVLSVDDERGTFGFADVLGALSVDLLEAEQRAKWGRSLGFVVRDVEVELAFTVTKSRDGTGGINLKVLGVGFEAGGGVATAAETVHRIKLTLGPANEAGVESGDTTEGEQIGVVLESRPPGERTTNEHNIS